MNTEMTIKIFKYFFIVQCCWQEQIVRKKKHWFKHKHMQREITWVSETGSYKGSPWQLCSIIPDSSGVV